jgi:tRNA-Thr(GGU) m(6)t(6)A37 methyltransferase TsaA
VSKAAPITLLPIGHVQSTFSEMAPSEEMRMVPSRLVLDADLADGLDGLSPGDEILVLFLCDRADGYLLRRHPRGDTSLPERGVFALRSQYRPNPIGVTVARIEAVEGHTLCVTGLDALDGSPLLDIKPYAPSFDTPAGAGQPRPVHAPSPVSGNSLASHSQE